MHTEPSPAKIGYSVADVCKMTGLCRQSIYNQINSGHLRSFKVGKRRLISPQALDEWVIAQEASTAA
jgi:excisionase family DNA binding protein